MRLRTTVQDERDLHAALYVLHRITNHSRFVRYFLSSHNVLSYLFIN